MYMDDINIFALSEKTTRNRDTTNKNIQPGYKSGIWDW